MADKIVAEFKQKEFNRLKDCVLNQISTIEMGLNIASVSRGQYASQEIWIPTYKEIDKLHETLIELRSNMLSSEERRLINEI